MLNKELREEQKREAIERMKSLNILPKTISEFERENLVNKSEFGGILYWVDDEEKKMISEFEKEFNALVYHIIKGMYKIDGEIITIYDFLYVSGEKEEWEYDREDLRGGFALAYSNNVNWGIKEFGSICVSPSVGGVRRVA